VTARQINDVSK